MGTPVKGIIEGFANSNWARPRSTDVSKLLGIGMGNPCYMDKQNTISIVVGRSTDAKFVAIIKCL